MDFGIGTVAETVHAAKTLGHALEGGKVANEMIGGDVDADFARGSTNEIHGPGVAPSDGFGRKR